MLRSIHIHIYIYIYVYVYKYVFIYINIYVYLSVYGVSVGIASDIIGAVKIPSNSVNKVVSNLGLMYWSYRAFDPLTIIYMCINKYVIISRVFMYVDIHIQIDIDR
jgi:hypothetical protein